MVNSAAYTGPVGICRLATIVLGIISAVVITIGWEPYKSLAYKGVEALEPTNYFQITAFIVAILSVIWLIIFLAGIIPQEIVCLAIDMVVHSICLGALLLVSVTYISFDIKCGEIPRDSKLTFSKFPVLLPVLGPGGRVEYANKNCTFTVCALVACLLELCNVIVYGAVAVLDLMKVVKNQNTN